MLRPQAGRAPQAARAQWTCTAPATRQRWQPGDRKTAPLRSLTSADDCPALPCPALYCLQVPYIEDPNTGVAMFESSAIVEYLEKTYGSSGSA